MHKMTNTPDNTIRFQIHRVKDISFFVNERLYEDNPNRRIRIEMNQSSGISPNNNLFNLTLKVFLFYEDNPSEFLAEIEVENVFIIADLEKYTEDGTGIPGELLISMVSISISHVRALMSKNIAGSVYQTIIVPIMNPVDVARHFFPKAFAIENSVAG